MVETGVVLLLLGTIVASYFIIEGRDSGNSLTPAVAAALLVANLMPAMALMVLIARRLAMRRAARSPTGGRGRLHVRLVALFSIIATVPTLLVVFFASMLFQGGVQFWFSERARTVLDSAERVAQIYVNENRERITREVVTMRGDVVANINQFGLNTPLFGASLFDQVVRRDLTEAAIFRATGRGQPQTIAMVNFDVRPVEQRLPAAAVPALRSGQPRVVTDAGDRVEAVMRLDPSQDFYLYVSRSLDARAIQQWREAQSAVGDYRLTLNRSQDLQLRFNVILLLVSLLIVAVVIWIALTLADRLVRPVGELVGAARRVTAGDLSARVPQSSVRDEVGILGNAFNRMTRRLEEQTGDLVSANAQLDSRRAFIEAVLSGVTAGVISVDDGHVVRLINKSAETLLKTGGTSPIGQKLADLAPELDRQLAAEEREDVVQLASSGEPRTLAVKTVKVEGGHVLTFDDITEQLLDQRRAAWSDVARRIAHEIKNPLTPIQLAAERLQRRYGSEITSDQPTFERLTGTIVRQVGDLRRMVDEFSSFARMPKPAFAEESLAEIARQALFLHEVAHPDIDFALDVPDPAPTLVCDRRLLGQALTNVVKNGIEAIQQKREEKKRRKPAADRVAVTIRQQGSKIVIEVGDTGIGLPLERARMTEPYMTTRAKGTGLGLAIVKKIVEEHFGQIEFEDVAGGGSLVRMIFDRDTLAQLAGTSGKHNEEATGTG
ncbi:MAG: two-component system, NtrC family, nitrogen regulation sensor histidine kinase NtrY [Sphingomonadales bacterium]|jgi:two-component system nitrogen regulation sensor histidine kinase NtrY|nr:two-component system, NtrC family, nitrogen regulation sensor histidine kinase NtrY [Sphingomonadales bacterium]